MPLEHAQGDAHVRGHVLKRALIGGDGGKHLGLARREREAAGEIPQVRFRGGVDCGIVSGRRDLGCRALCSFRRMFGDYRLSRRLAIPRTGAQIQHAGGEEQRVDADDHGDQQHDNGYGARQVDHQQRGCADRDGGHVVERPPHAAPQVGGAQELCDPDEHCGIERHEHARAQEVDDFPDNVRPACLHSEHRAD